MARLSAPPTERLGVFYKLNFLACDGCEEDFDGAEHAVVDLKRQARKEGWVFTRGESGTEAWCPDCTKERARANQPRVGHWPPAVSMRSLTQSTGA